MPYVYLLQPAELVGTNRYKIGISSRCDLNRLRSYGSGTRYIHYFECKDYIAVENSLKDNFNRNKKIKCIKGREYFEGDEQEIIDIFLKIMIKYLTGGDILIPHNDDNIKEDSVNDKMIENSTDEKEFTRTEVSNQTLFIETINKFKFRQ